MVLHVNTRGSARSTWQGDAAVELSRLLARLRWRLGLERALIFGVRGLLLGGLGLSVLSAVAWLIGADTLLWASAAPLIGALAMAVVRWPSRRDAALAADKRLRLDERLTTSVELLERSTAGRFDNLQLMDAVGRARRTPTTWLALTPRIRMEAAAAAGTLFLAAVMVVLLPSVPRPLAAPTEMTQQSDVARQDDLGMLPLPAESAVPTAVPLSAQPLAASQADANLASRVQQEQSARSALDSLSKALRSVSAGQAAADAIDQGDFTTAQDELQTLADEADQLSDAAKQQLAQALQQASAATAQTDRQLADRERQAAQALSRPGYSDQRQALRNLAAQVPRSGAKSVSADQLQHELGQLGQAAQQSGGLGINGQQGGPGIGSAPGPSPLGDDASRLDTAGETVQVPTKLASGRGVRPLDGSQDQLSMDPSLTSRNVSELSRPQLTGQVAPEQNLVPGEQRPVVRGYFR